MGCRDGRPRCDHRCPSRPLGCNRHHHLPLLSSCRHWEERAAPPRRTAFLLYPLDRAAVRGLLDSSATPLPGRWESPVGKVKVDGREAPTTG